MPSICTLKQEQEIMLILNLLTAFYEIDSKSENISLKYNT